MEDLGLSEVLDELDASRAEIIDLYQERVQAQVQAYRSLAPSEVRDPAALLLTQFLRLMHYRLTSSSTQIHVSVLSELLNDLAVVSRTRARQGVGVGDLLAAILLLISSAREVVLESLPDDQLRAANRTWSIVEQTAASALAWMIDEHRTNLDAQH